MPKGIKRTVNGWIIRQQIPVLPDKLPLILMLHGWTGDEDSMWVFANRLPDKFILIAPRGLYPSPTGGYSWHERKTNSWPWVDDFQPAIDALLDLLTPTNFPEADFNSLYVIGFSQGAALTYALALQYPMLIKNLAGLSGFLPEGSAALARNRPLLGKRVFIAHGTQDNLVPVGRARQAVDTLELAGALVNYCEDDVGHKLSASCFRGLEDFFSRE